MVPVEPSYTASHQSLSSHGTDAGAAAASQPVAQTQLAKPCLLQVDRPQRHRRKPAWLLSNVSMHSPPIGQPRCDPCAPSSFSESCGLLMSDASFVAKQCC